ncbi:MAG: hypothetical protein WCG82_10670 [Bacteroidota bacterium]
MTLKGLIKEFLRRSNGYFSVFALITLIYPAKVFSQDKVYKTDNTVIEVKVQEVGTYDIKYKKFSNLSGPSYIINKREVKMIVYENGEKEFYTTAETYDLPSRQIPMSSYSKDGNFDFIVKNNGDTVNCTIIVIRNGFIEYFIKRPGLDKHSKIQLDQLKLYYYKNQWHYPEGIGMEVDMARNYILTGQINNAIACYSKIIAKDSVNPALLAEDAYALALGGIYDAALMRIDQSSRISANSLYLHYFISQIFALIGYDDLSAEFLNLGENKNAPDWIASVASELFNKYRNRALQHKKSKNEIIADFKRANMLASRQFYFQSIGIFRKIIDTYPNEYLPYFGYSIALENTGVMNSAIMAIEKGIALKGNDPEKRKFLYDRILILKQRSRSKQKIKDGGRPQMMAYAGIMAGPSSINLNGKYGYFTSGSSNGSIDFGLSSYDGSTSFNIGLSMYLRKGILVSGAGFQMISGSSGTDFACKISLGISLMNKKRTSSTDIFFDVSLGLNKGSLSTYGLSIGKSIYFGKRK